MRAQRRARDLRAGSGRRAMPAATERRRFGSPRSAPQPAGARPTGPSSSRLCTVSSSGLSRELGAESAGFAELTFHASRPHRSARAGFGPEAPTAAAARARGPQEKNRKQGMKQHFTIKPSPTYSAHYTVQAFIYRAPADFFTSISYQVSLLYLLSTRLAACSKLYEAESLSK